MWRDTVGQSYKENVRSISRERERKRERNIETEREGNKKKKEQISSIQEWADDLCVTWAKALVVGQTIMGEELS